MKTVTLNEAMIILRLNASGLSKEIKLSRTAISHFTTGKRLPSIFNQNLIINTLDEYRDAEIKRLQDKIEFLRSLEWEI